MRGKALILFTIAAAVVTLFAGLAWLTRANGLQTAVPDPKRRQTAAPATSDPRGVFAGKPITDCRAVDLPPPPAEINTVLDHYSKRLLISFLDPRLGEDRRISISYEDPTCQENPRLKAIVDGALNQHARIVADTCRSMAKIVRIGTPDVRVARIELAKRWQLSHPDAISLGPGRPSAVSQAVIRVI